MRIFYFLVFCLLALTGVLWISRPVALGDPGGVFAFIDRTVPQAAAWRSAYLHLPDTAAAATAQSASTGTATSPATAKPKVPPSAVVTVKAEIKSLDLTFEGLGTVQSIASVTIKPRVDGQITAVPVAEGAAVKAGDLLFKFDDAALKAQLAQAEAQIAKDKAQLEQNKHDLARDDELLKQKFIAPQVQETAQTTLNQTTAQIAVDTAQRDGIVTQLSYMEIRSPVAGRIGSIVTKAGAAVKSGDSLAVVNQIDPIYIAFAVPQNRLADLRAAMAAGAAQVRLLNDPKAPAGQIAFIENTVDTTSGTVQIKATMPNPGEKLWPGAFANVVLVTGTEKNALTVPSAAVQIGQKGPYVFAVINGKASLKPVTVERAAGDVSVITAGLNPGDDVVIKGQMALTDGADVVPAKTGEAKSGDATSGDARTATEKTASAG